MPRAKKQHLKRRADGRYRCSYNGKLFYGYTEEEALRARDEYKRAEERGMLAAVQPVSVAEYALEWLPLHKGDVSVKCYNDYAKRLETLIKVIGQKNLPDVSVDDAARVWAEYKGLSASTIKRGRMLYVALFDTAMENDLCRKNPFRAKHGQPPKGYSGTHRALTPEELDLIQRTQHRFRPGVMVMLYAGLRRGEVLALRSDMIDLAAGYIHVGEAVRFAGNHPNVVEPKTKAGTREVPVPFPLRRELLGINGLIAPSAKGEMMTTSAFHRAWSSYLHALSVTAGHPVSIRPHDLRHTYCTMLRDAGVDLKQAMIWMGHADEKMILRIYDHVSEERTQKSIEKYESELEKGQNKGQKFAQQ